jgi:hypothetical protein
MHRLLSGMRLRRTVELIEFAAQATACMRSECESASLSKGDPRDHIQQTETALKRHFSAARSNFPLTAENVGAVLGVLRVAAPDRAAYSLDDLVEDLV